VLIDTDETVLRSNGKGDRLWLDVGRPIAADAKAAIFLIVKFDGGWLGELETFQKRIVTKRFKLDLSTREPANQLTPSSLLVHLFDH
jgi:hypothetical protein